MSEVVGEAVLRITTDDSGVDSGITSAGKKAGVGYSKGFSSGLKNLAGAAGLAVGGAALVNFAKGGITAATDLQDTLGALGVIIGEGPTAAIENFADKSASAFGIAKVDALQAAQTFSTFGKSAGLAGDDLATFATDFTSLAGDLASFNGGSTEDAITAIGSALRGEAEPIRRYGVLLDDATLKQAAVRLGIIKTTKDALTPQQKVLAAQAEIYRQTSDAQGDFERTSDSAANTQKRLTAQLKDVQTKLGTQLLPVLTKGSQALSEFITEMEDGTGAGGQFAEILRETVDVGKGILDFFNGLPGPVKKYGAELAIAALVITKVSSGLDGLIGKLKTTTITQDGVARSSYNMGAALRNVAGAGGLVLLSQGLQETDNDARTLKTTLGGAGAGFAIAGPIGAAVGALGGFATALLTAQDASTASFDATRGAADAYAGAIDNVTGKLKDNTNAEIANALQKDNPRVLKAANALKISNDTLIRSLQGSPAAIKEVNEALRRGELAGTQFSDGAGGAAGAAETLTQALFGTRMETGNGTKATEGLTQAFSRTRKEEELAAYQGRQFTFALKGIPTDVATQISAPGMTPTLRDVESLVDKYKRTPDQVRTLVKALNVKVTADQLATLIDRSRTLDEIDPSVKVTADTSAARAAIQNLQRFFKGFAAQIDFPGDGKGRNQSGTENFAGGFTTLNEAGTERVYLPPGTRVMTAAQTRQAEAREASAAAPVVVSGGGGTLVVQQNYYGPTSTFERQRDAEWAARYHTAGAPVRMG